MVDVRGGRHQVWTGAGALRAQRLHGPDDRARVALVGQTALLLGGDAVEVDVEVGSGARLELVEVAGTVAYHGRGQAASWRTRIRVGPGASLLYAGEPFVLSDGADVSRSLSVELADAAAATLRETLVFGRSGQAGGWLDAETVLRREGVEFCRERLVTDAASRALPGVLSGVKVMQSILALGSPAPKLEQAQNFRLLDRGSTLTRSLRLRER